MPPTGKQRSCKRSLNLGRRIELETWIYDRFKVSRSHACLLALMSRSTFYRKSTVPSRAELRKCVNRARFSEVRTAGRRCAGCGIARASTTAIYLR